MRFQINLLKHSVGSDLSQVLLPIPFDWLNADNFQDWHIFRDCFRAFTQLKFSDLFALTLTKDNVLLTAVF